MRNGKRSENTTSPPFLSRVLAPLPRLSLLRRLSLKNARLPFFFFLVSNRSYWGLLFPHRHNLCKNTSILGRTVLKISLHGMPVKPLHHYTNSPYGFHSFHSVLIGRTCLNNLLCRVNHFVNSRDLDLMKVSWQILGGCRCPHFLPHVKRYNRTAIIRL